ncbi:hypothetical protein UFOVP26_36 [uncultured Caudovirales phage]|uniref:Uncharacterized protein n=1 Tax=uncultured Caudovirales phage TaxID=2100421 RepID=A0A6J7WMB8_9CAUD|nr:hypothetical protein UFOVP26_36 [uncultured Caudovirales phage]CAB4123817.1 hypothetical protein UFOVP44_61 [uncultured Caudovirales phage]CAB5219249.1 hypothetical protein UFOVP220_52 [uncultured Caudovirales phage]
MGYRSEVSIVVYGKPDAFQRHFDNFFAKDVIEDEKLDLSWIIPKTKVVVSEDESIKYFSFNIDHIKWYSAYPEIIHLEKFYMTAKEAGLNAEFVRVGEEFDDVEVWQDGDDLDWLLSVERKVHNELEWGLAQENKEVGIEKAVSHD